MAGGRAELQRLIADLGAISKDLQREMRPAIKEGAQPMLMGIRRNASWSSRIPKATRISTSFSGRGAGPGVSIITDAKRAPHARPYENDGVPGTFWVQLFGNKRRWYERDARPFFGPAVIKYGPEVVDAIDRRITTITSKHGF